MSRMKVELHVFFQTEVVTANKLYFRPYLIQLRREYMMNLVTLHIVYTTRHVISSTWPGRVPCIFSVERKWQQLKERRCNHLLICNKGIYIYVPPPSSSFWQRAWAVRVRECMLTTTGAMLLTVKKIVLRSEINTGERWSINKTKTTRPRSLSLTWWDETDGPIKITSQHTHVSKGNNPTHGSIQVHRSMLAYPAARSR